VIADKVGHDDHDAPARHALERPMTSMRMIDIRDRAFRVIAEGENEVGHGLSIEEAFAVAEFSRERGKRRVAIVDETSGTLVDETDLRRQFIEEG
jgi:hypothetical protein